MSQQPQTSHAEDTKRIAKNTLMLYGRMLFSMVVSLYTSRLVLNTLGVVDYGINNAVGGFVVMFNLISNSLSGSVSRFLTFELGKGDFVKLRRIFSTSINIQVALAIIVLIVAETIGLWFLNTHMTFPQERLKAANWIYQASIISFAVSLICIPYRACIISHERMGTFAYIGIFEVLIRLGTVLFIANTSWNIDKLIFYALTIISSSVCTQIIYIYYSTKHFKECRYTFIFDKIYWNEMSAFAGWSFIGSTSSMLRDHGINVLFNVFVGPILNAARGISTTINNTIASFVANFMTAIRPQIIKSYAAEDWPYTFRLVFLGSRFSFYILLFLMLPILFETDFILTIWLTQYPPHTIIFTRLLLIMTIIDSLSNTLIMLLMATGRIRNYQISVGLLVLLNFPISYLLLKHNFRPESTLIVGIVIAICSLFLRLYILYKQVRFPVLHFFNRVCGRTILVTIVAVVPMYTVHIQFIGSTWARFICTSVSGAISCGLAIWFLGCDAFERDFIVNRLTDLKQKIYAKRVR